jgi:hypothetical protein
MDLRCGLELNGSGWGLVNMIMNLLSPYKA